MNEKLKLLLEKAQTETENALSTRDLQDLKAKFLGKSGEITALMKEMRNIPPEERSSFGKLVNDLKEEVANLFSIREKTLKDKELKEQLEKEAVDITLPGTKQKMGSIHPLNIVKNEIISAFAGMGFEIFEGPEIETDYYCFQALNIPKDHPARDMQDTFYIGNDIVLRSQTSTGQVRVMENKKPPIKILSPGRVYRADDDASHSPMFHQCEGLVVDKGVSLCDLQGLLNEFVKVVFDKETKTRLRPSYFPFTEPSVEVDVTCSKCHGKGCSLCKGTGWIEILGAGVVNKKVLENCGIDSNEYSGLAFGLGLERIAMIKYGVNDIRTFFENNVKFLKQFDRR
ncbi:MAG: phenylalanine--tRNA ligase subunit alpha [Clostridia bacterium]|nr:phenylalanine--tRNA ligase subunit alpha [Clostridia bacterium]